MTEITDERKDPASDLEQIAHAPEIRGWSYEASATMRLADAVLLMVVELRRLNDQFGTQQD